jgi:hypothetical protein
VVKFGVGEMHINAVDHEKPCSIFHILPKGLKKWWGEGMDSIDQAKHRDS